MHIKPERPYFDAWLTRTRKQLSVSGQLSQTAHLLALKTDESEDRWRVILRELIDGKIPPTLELISLLENTLQNIQANKVTENSQIPLFFNDL